MEKMTGKPSIDKPWLKYYDEEVLNKVFDIFKEKFKDDFDFIDDED